jgi:uncharacterized protein (TIGR00159 family)
METSSAYELIMPFVEKVLILRNFLDVLIITMLVYLFLFLLKKTKATPIMVGIFFLAALFGLSKVLNLEVTQQIFRLFFGTLLIIFAVVFQKELRRFFEFIGVLGIRRKILPPTDIALKTILQALKYFSQNKVGAIVVLSGRENFDRHLEGGFTLNGRISSALLISIFDSSSPGHDGAIIIDGDKIKKFAVHLPLAEGVEAAKKYGTRHRAALGLSEVSDAMAIVVSEERGTISIAYNKSLVAVNNDAELEQKIASFITKNTPLKNFTTYFEWLKENIPLIMFSFLVATVIWSIIFIQNFSIIQRKFVVPIEFKNVPQNYVIDGDTLETVLTFSGRENDFKPLKPEDLTVSLDISTVKPGKRTLLLEKEDVEEIPNLSLVQISPDSIKINLKKQEPPPQEPANQ